MTEQEWYSLGFCDAVQLSVFNRGWLCNFRTDDSETGYILSRAKLPNGESYPIYMRTTLTQPELQLLAIKMNLITPARSP